MRISLIATTALCFATATAAQLQPSEQLRNNNPYLVISTATHPTSGQNFNWPPVNHPGYSNGSGVPQNTWIWRVYEQQTGHRGEPYEISGFTMVWRLSAASNSNGPGAYIPETVLLPTLPRATPPGLDPDFTQLGAPLVQVPMMPMVQTSQTFRVTHTFTTVNVTMTDYAILLKYQGGEEQNKPDGGPGAPSQGTCGSWQDGELMGYAVDGFVQDPNTGTQVVTYKTERRFITWVSLMTDQPSLAVHSDWGQRRIAPLTPPLLGHSQGSYYSDLGSAGAAAFGYSIRAEDTVYSNGLVAMLLNVGPFLPITGLNLPLPWGLTNIAVDLTSPFLFLLDALGLTLDGTGDADSIKIQVPGAQPNLIGVFVTAQAVTVDQNLAIGDSTEAVAIKVVQ